MKSFTYFVSFFLLLLAASAERWDGVVITQENYDGLQAFRHELVDPAGYLRSWNGTGIGACSGGWIGIKCVLGQVVAIQLPWKGLGGQISSKVAQLTGLRKLNLHDNSIGGEVPSSLAALPNLRGVYLFNNLLTGSIPASLLALPLLQSLDLSNNHLLGELPTSLSPSTKLYRLNLSFNNLSGKLPETFTRCRSLSFFSVHHNNLSGTIPDTWAAGGGIFALQTLNLDHNSFSGGFPGSLSRLPRLQVLTAGHNRINGTIPSSLSRLPELVELTLENNLLSGEIPEPIGEIRTLTSFNVSNNHLAGPVPPLLAYKFNSSSFSGNLQLCGYSTKVPCPPPTTHRSHPPPPEPSRGSKLGTRDIILIVTGSVLAILLLLCCILLCFLIRKRSEERQSPAARAEKSAEEAEASGETGGKLVHFDGAMAFTADDLLCATAEIMGKSTYGTVYKATLEDGSQVAVKRLREKIAKGQREFEAEVNVLGRIRHRNLLALRAYYLGPKGEKLLVFDYMTKGSLSAFLHARLPEMAVDWPTRMKIAMGVARGLHHLHAGENMVHANLTSSNVVLDGEASPRIADFGLSRLMSAAANTNVVATAGVLGYRAPELSKLKNASSKTDVYSLGVMMLELLTGKSPSEAMEGGLDLPRWVASVVKEEWTSEVFDLELMRGAAEAGGDELVNTLKLALHCVDPSPAARPEAGEVLRQLEAIRPDLAVQESTGEAAVEEVEEEVKKE